MIKEVFVIGSNNRIIFDEQILPQGQLVGTTEVFPS